MKIIESQVKNKKLRIIHTIYEEIPLPPDINKAVDNSLIHLENELIETNFISLDTEYEIIDE